MCCSNHVASTAKDWNAPSESKSARAFRDDIASFEGRALHAFHDGDANENEYCLEHSSLHEQFCSIVEVHVRDFLADRGWTVESFAAKLRVLLHDGDGHSWAREGAWEIVGLLVQTTDFKLFAEAMRTKARKTREAK